MENALDGAFTAMDAADADSFSFGASGTLSQIAAFNSSSHAGLLRSHIASLRSAIVSGGIAKLRESSAVGATGFGAMNKPELKILTERLGALDPDNTDPAVLRKTLEGVRDQVNIVKADVIENVPHDRLRAIGLGHWVPKAAPAAPSEEDIKATMAANNMTRAQVIQRLAEQNGR